jgi:hypothetical protein
MIQKAPYFLGLDLNIDSVLRAVTAVPVAESIDASRPSRFSQFMRHLPLTTFSRCLARYAGEHKVKSFSCLDQYLCMAFAQLTYRESLRDIESSLRAQAAKLYHLWIHDTVSRNTFANANATRDWRIYEGFAERLIGIARLAWRGTLRRRSGRDDLRARRHGDTAKRRRSVAAAQEFHLNCAAIDSGNVAIHPI